MKQPCRSSDRDVLLLFPPWVWYNDCTFVQSEAVPPLRPVSQGLYPQSTAWQVNAACAALPSLRSWYNDCTFVQSEAASPASPCFPGIPEYFNRLNLNRKEREYVGLQ